MYHNLIQVLAAARLLNRPHGVSTQEAAERLGIDKRSVYRLFNRLSELGYPLYSDPERGHRYYLTDPGSSRNWWIPLPIVDFSLEDRVLLDWIFENASRQPSLEEPVKELRKKLSFVGAATGYAFEPKETGAGTKPSLALLSAAVNIPKARDERVVERIGLLTEAITERKVCEVSYESRESGEVKTYPMNPLRLFESEGGLYVFVQVKRHGTIRILAIERIRDLSMLDETFSWPKDFNPDMILSDPFGIIQGKRFQVSVRFSEDQAPYIKDRSWPDGYQLLDNDDGSLTMRFETGALFGLTRWILSWGRSATVLEPSWLCDYIRDELKSALDSYSIVEEHS